MMEHKGYIGRVVYDDDAEIFAGEVINTRDVITFQGQTVDELKQAFRDSVEDYLAFCSERGEAPEKPFSGRLMMRIPADLHRDLHLEARHKGVSLNALIKNKLARSMAEQQEKRQR